MSGRSLSLQWLKFLTWPGLALSTAGLVAGGLSGWQWLPVVMLLVGIGLLLVGFSFSGGRFWQQRSTQAGTNATVAVLALVVILGLVNFLAVRSSTRLDLTENQIFTLAPATQTITQALTTPVKVVVFDVAQNAQDVQILKGYRSLTSNFSYEYIDPYANPQQAQAFGVTAPGMVFLEVGEDRRFLQSVGTPDPQGLGAPERLSERRLTNALDQIVNDRTLTVYFTQGHEELTIDGSAAGYATAAANLEEKSYVVAPLNLAEEQAVPADADVVVVAGPAQDFFEGETKALQDYLDQGGGVLLLLDPRTDGGLTPLLNDWGVVLDDRLVLDTSGTGQFVGLGPAAPLVSDYGSHPITQEFGQGRSFFPLVRPVETEELEGTTTTPLLFTNAQSQAEAISDDGNLAFDPEAAPEGPYVLGVALSRPVSEAVDREDDTADAASTPETSEAEDTADLDPLASAIADNSESRLVVIGNSSFASDGLFEQQLNGDVFLNSVSWLGQQGDDTLSIQPKTVTNRRILITPQQQIGLGIFSLLVLPLLGLIMAILMWLRRR
ncbi:MAG: Gldg family protein [Cyanobacteria bacterium]|nr:Gldg family protein [Cyanobacteriota bacterium]MDA0864881.1 Gldg family protein [Cyanobacteriota bacterium]